MTIICENDYYIGVRCHHFRKMSKITSFCVSKASYQTWSLTAIKTDSVPDHKQIQCTL